MRRWPYFLHPFLIAVAPILVVAAHNAGELALTQLLAPFAIVLATTGIVLAVLWLVLRVYVLAALATSALMLVLMSYGRIADRALEKGASSALTVHGPAVAASLLVLGACAYGLWRGRHRIERLQRIGNVAGLAALFMLASSGVQLGFQLVSDRAPTEAATHAAVEPPETAAAVLAEAKQRAGQRATLPDVYYIVPDGYARGDVLARHYDFDNGEFLAYLRSRGFYVAEGATANYPMTFMSLAATLNMTLLEPQVAMLRDAQGAEARARTIFYNAISNALVPQVFKALGYRYVAVETSWRGTENAPLADLRYNLAPILGSELYGVLLRTTAARSLAPSVADMHFYALDRLAAIADLPEPTFAFVHLLLPHNPYVIDRHGQVRANVPLSLNFAIKTGGWERKDAYIDQVIYLNGRLRQAIDYILKVSPEPPIIVVQSDHGSASTSRREGKEKLPPLPSERLPSLSALLVPESVRAALYPEMSNVNTFRVILREVYGLPLPPSPDRAFFAWYRKPYAMEEVTP